MKITVRELKELIAEAVYEMEAEGIHETDMQQECDECGYSESEALEEYMNEAKKKPSSGLTKKQKSSVVKRARKGKDIGKKGKSFEDIAKKAGGGEKGKKIAAAAMWKNIKRKG